MNFLVKVVAKEMDPLLARVLKLWVNEKPNPLIETYNKKPDLFKQLDKAEGHPDLFRVLAISKEELKVFMDTKTMANAENDLESWSTSLKGLQTFFDRATDSETSGSDYMLVLKRNVPMAERVVYIPALLPIPGIEGSDEGWIEEEEEVICVAKDLEWKWVKKILFPGDRPTGKSIPMATIKYQLKD
jgi:hypothetical protein